MVVVSNCDSLTDWTTANGGDVLEPIDKKEGTNSIKVIGFGAVVEIAQTYDPAGAWDWSTYDHITFWFKSDDISDMKFRIWSGANPANNYLQWNRQFVQQVKAADTWYEVKLYLDDYDTSVGAIDLTLVDGLVIYVLDSVAVVTFLIDDIRIDLADPVKVKIGTAANLDYVSDDCVELDIWRDSLSGIGRWQIVLENTANKWGGRFIPDEAIEIKINGVLMMNGYVDDVVPFLAAGGVYKNRIKVLGRDYGMDLAQLYHTTAYVEDNADDIVDLALAAAASEITYLSPTTAPIIDYEFNRTYLADGIRDICKLVDYDFYVEDNAANPKRLQFFAVGAAGQHTAVNLTAVAASATNNILRLEKGEKVGADIRNYIEAHAGGLIDHWTDMNVDGDKTGLVLYLPLNEGVGATAYDQTSNDYDGTITGAAWAAGRYAQALDFERADPDQVVIADITLNAGFTIATWFRLESIVGGEIKTIISKALEAYICVDGATLNGFVYDGIDYVPSVSAGAVAAATWYHVALTWDQTNLRIYLDGELMDTEPRADLFADTANNVELGRLVAVNYFDGLIDEVRIYNTVLTDNEVNLLYLTQPGWIAGPNCTATNETTIFLPGKSSVKCIADQNNTDLIVDLDFSGSKYGYATLDISDRNEGSYLAYKNYTVIVNKACRIRLKDSTDRWIEFYKYNLGRCDECTDEPTNGVWRKIVFPYGDGLEIKASGSFISDYWQYVAPAVAFDWAAVETIRFTSDPSNKRNLNDYFIIDGLSIPDIDITSIQEDTGSQSSYGKRMLPIYRPDIKNQVELDVFAIDQIDKHKDPLETIKITASGQTGSVYAGQSLDVQAPSHGIAALTKYRIMKLHHQVRKSSEDSPVAGYIFLTDFDLVKHEINPTQVIDPVRFARYKSPIEATIRDMRDKLIRLTKLSPLSTSGSSGGGGAPGAVTPYYISGNDVVFYDIYTMIRPETTGSIDLGSNAIKWGDIWGIVHYSDLYMSDLECPLCGERFKPTDTLTLTVREVIKKKNELDEEYEEIRCVPTHKRCPLLVRIKNWIRSILSR